MKFTIQILVRSQKVDIGPYIERLSEIRRNNDNMLLGVLMDDYINFIDVLSQEAKCLQLLPLERQAMQTGKRQETVYEPDSETVFAAIIPEYLGGVLYGALCESRASEQAARRTAMDSATKNADEMIEGLSLQYNRARQGAITQEITEIVAGAEN